MVVPIFCGGNFSRLLAFSRLPVLLFSWNACANDFCVHAACRVSLLLLYGYYDKGGPRSIRKKTVFAKIALVLVLSSSDY